MILSEEVSIDAKNPTVSPSVEIFEVDVFNYQTSTIALLHQLGKKVICYFSVGTAENTRPDYGNFTAVDIGEALVDWPGENYVNISSPAVWDIMKARIKLASDKNCDGIEPDNTDIYSNDGGGLNITPGDVIIYFQKLAQEIHSYNMSIGLKNSQEILPNVSSLAQFAINEECSYQDSTCSAYADFTNPSQVVLSSGIVPKPVFHVEYVNYTDTSAGSDPAATEMTITNDFWPNVTEAVLLSNLCLTEPQSTGNPLETTLKLSTIIKTLELDGWMMDCNGLISVTATTDFIKAAS
ncbi:hypothetical protein G7Y89_g7805 [Cudoniella acicularis]|uniref:alpha-galactosidase n=1 Tax=Cudoniella acicularis TaxID=354080 RepID=A0A8H4W1M1_9HELO|nr:hypothetical protein G7Y89_g7805 [Cudoniella acicularis]